ncbi:MAG: hypothetical protein ACJ76H_04360 [Bacteriovoracaceae bacterium]
MKTTLLLILVSFPLYAADDCSLNPEAIKGALNQKAVKSYKVMKKDKRDLIESAILKNGVKVTHEIGGCAHIGSSFTYEKFGKLNLTDKKAVLDMAEKLLKSTPVNGSVSHKILLEGITGARTTKEIYQGKLITLPCGDANCEVNVAETGKLRVSYDFAL